MNNPQFKSLLKDRTDWTVAKVAAAIYSSRARVLETLNNQPNRGRQIRPKLVKFFQRHFQHTLPETRGPAWQEILRVLGWNEDGSVRATSSRETLRSVKSAPGNIPQGTFLESGRLPSSDPHKTVLPCEGEK